MNSTKTRAARILDWIARIIGLIVLVILLMIVIGEAITSWQEGDTGFDPESLYIIIPTAIALAGYVVAWRRRVAGGIVLILVSIVLGFLPYFSTRNSENPWSVAHALSGWLILGLPFFVVGVLFIVAAFLRRSPSR
jgi:hypothetical protein